MRRLLMLLVLVGLLAPACSKGSPSSSASVPPSGSAGPSVVVVPKGAYGFDAYNVVATLQPGTSGWTLKVTNNTGQLLAKPDVYELAANDGRRINATVVNSSPVPDKATKTFTVRFDPGFNKDNVGLILLEFGTANFGAFRAPA